MADCINYKIDSSVSGLSFAKEICAGQLPNFADDGYDPIWWGQEPNEYDDFGGEVTLKARSPIKRGRQNSKGTPVDLDASGGYNQDMTQHINNRLLPGFFFAQYHEKPTTKPYEGAQLAVTAATASSDRFTVATNARARGFVPGQIILVTGPDIVNAGNSGLFVVDEVGPTYIGVTGNLTDEAFIGEVIITVVGWQFGAADLSIVAPADIATLTNLSTLAAATGVLSITSTQNAIAEETVIIGDVTYTFKAAAAAPYEVTVGGSRLTSIANLVATINGNNLLTPVAHPLVTATDPNDGTMGITAKIGGTVGNIIPTTETMTQGSWGSATMTGGTGVSLLSLGLSVGEWLYLGGDDTASQFANNSGYGRVKTISPTAIVFDKTTWAPEAEAATGLSIRVYTGSFLRNEDDPALIETSYYQFERTLGEDENGPQAEYLLGSVANELTFNLPLTDNVTMDLGFIAANFEERDGTQGLKAGEHYEIAPEEAYNTTSDVVRYRMAELDNGNSFPDALFAYITTGNLKINNGVEPIKVIGKFGALDVSTGNFMVSGELTALFSNVKAHRAVRLSSDVTLDIIMAKQNAGYVFDIPLLTLGGGRIDVTLGKPITIPLDAEAAECAAGYTASYTTFDYLPELAMPEVQ